MLEFLCCVAYVLVGLLVTSLHTYYKGRKPESNGTDELAALLGWPIWFLVTAVDEWHDWLKRKGGK